MLQHSQAVVKACCRGWAARAASSALCRQVSPAPSVSHTGSTLSAQGGRRSCCGTPGAPCAARCAADPWSRQWAACTAASVSYLSLAHGPLHRRAGASEVAGTQHQSELDHSSSAASGRRGLWGSARAWVAQRLVALLALAQLLSSSQAPEQAAQVRTPACLRAPFCPHKPRLELPRALHRWQGALRPACE